MDYRAMLTAADVFIGDLDDTDPRWNQSLNLNDAFGWAVADAQYVADEELPRVGELFFRYGWAGIMYWVAVEKRPAQWCEFADVRRQIEFVRHEEAIRREIPEWAYEKRQYTIGEPP